MASNEDNLVCSHDHSDTLNYLVFRRYGVFAKDAKMPTRKTFGAAGIDLYTVKHETFPPGTVRVLPTGLTVSIPKGYYGRISDCSSVASLGLHVLAGVHDYDYSGEIFVTVANLHKDNNPVSLIKGAKLCQIIVQPYIPMVPVLADQESWRASNDCTILHYRSGMGYVDTNCIALRECTQSNEKSAHTGSDECREDPKTKTGFSALQ